MRHAEEFDHLAVEIDVFIQLHLFVVVQARAVPIRVDGAEVDLCAAPGGKLLAAAETLPPGARIVAAEASVERLRLLDDNARRLGIAGHLRVVMDAERPALRGLGFDDPRLAGSGLEAEQISVRPGS